MTDGRGSKVVATHYFNDDDGVVGEDGMALFLSLLCFKQSFANENSLSSVYLGSREGDPASEQSRLAN